MQLVCFHIHFKTNSSLPMKDCIPTVSFVQPTPERLVLPTQEPSDESDKDSNTDSLPTIFKEHVKESIAEQIANEKCNIVEKNSMANKGETLQETKQKKN